MSTTHEQKERTPCTLDTLDEADFDRFIQTTRNVMRVKFGMTETDVDRIATSVLSDISDPSAATTRTFGDLRYCRDVRRNQVASGLYAGAMGLNLVVTIILVYSMINDRITSPVLHTILWGSTIGGLALTVYQLRNVILLLAKVAWYGMGPSTQAMLVLTATSLAVMIARGFAQSPTALIVLMSLGGLLTSSRIYFSAKTAVHPESMYMSAGMAALNRVLTGRKISQARAYYTKKTAEKTSPQAASKKM